MTINEILSYQKKDINRMSDAELRKVVNATRKAVNQRLTRLEKVEGGKYSPAYMMMQQSGGKLKTKGLTRKELKQEFLRGQNFLHPSMKTATTKGFKEFRKKISQKVQSDELLSGEEVKKLQEATAKLAELYPDIWTSYNVRASMAEKIRKNPNARVSTLIKTGMNTLEEEYAKEQTERAMRNSEFFGTVI